MFTVKLFVLFRIVRKEWMIIVFFFRVYVLFGWYS